MELVFKVALDIERYPEILAYVQSGQVKNRTDHSLDAVLTLGVRQLNLSYACRVDFEKNKRISVTTEEDIFKYLKADCLFTEIAPNETRIEYELVCEMSKRSLEVLAGLLLPYNTKHTLSAFEKHLKLLAKP